MGCLISFLLRPFTSNSSNSGNGNLRIITTGSSSQEDEIERNNDSQLLGTELSLLSVSSTPAPTPETSPLSTPPPQAKDPQIMTWHMRENLNSDQDLIHLSCDEDASNSVDGKRLSLRRRRTIIPEKPHCPLNLWSIMKNSIGKDLSKVPLPVNFNEPISMLQRLCENFEYSHLLDSAANCRDPTLQVAYVAAFSITSYSATANRTGKPFNPLLGETFEFDRTIDMGWRFISEQVSHHPPTSSFYCEGKGWKVWRDFNMTSSFRGKYLKVNPLGTTYVLFENKNRLYTWDSSLTTTINNIILGKLWIEHHGLVEIKGHEEAQGLKCILKYEAYSMFSSNHEHSVSGVVTNSSNDAKWSIDGTWDGIIEITKILSVTGTEQKPIYNKDRPITVWTRMLPDPRSEKYYNFTIFACQLNEMEDNVAPTDSRLRPDQRLMEIGDWDNSNSEKLRLESKQRAKRISDNIQPETSKENKSSGLHTHEPNWFILSPTGLNGSLIYQYNHEYWYCKNNQLWDRCPNIF